MDTKTIIFLIFVIVFGLATAFLGWHAFKSHKKIKSLEQRNEADAKKAEELVKEAQFKADVLLQEAKEEGQKNANALIASAKKEYEKSNADLEERKNAIVQKEAKLDQKEASLDKREDAIINREAVIDKQKDELNQRSEALAIKEKEAQDKLESVLNELQKVANRTRDQAKDELRKRVEEKERKRIALYEAQKEAEAQSTAEDKAKTLRAIACEKFAQDVTNERNSSTIALPNDDRKGRIIGRDGRNIKSMEGLFGVSLIIDDTPETLTVSCFDPIRREKAKLTLEALIKDGRIQPGRIEDLYSKISKEFDENLRRIGEQTVFKLGLPRRNPGLYPYIGRLKYRTSYGQSVLDHSIQVAYLSSVRASELGLDPVRAKRAGLLHDIGKAIDAEREGSHVQLGSRLAKKFNEPDVVINAIESHHGDCPKKYLISELVTAADTLSAARPGARSEQLETYIKRLQQLEKICSECKGVQSSYALQSGRDLRVRVNPDIVSDEDAKAIAIQVRDKIEETRQFPGQIIVTVIREKRYQETAK